MKKRTTASYAEKKEKMAAAYSVDEQMCWHYDHSKERQVKDLNFVASLYRSQDIGLQIGFQLITKTEYYADEKTGKTRRRSATGKTDYFRALIAQAVRNQVKFRYVLCDVWLASAENMNFVKQGQRKDFVRSLKTNRKIALARIKWILGLRLALIYFPFSSNIANSRSPFNAPPEVISTSLNAIGSRDLIEKIRILLSFAIVLTILLQTIFLNYLGLISIFN